MNTYGRFSNPASGEYDIYIDVNGDGVYDFILFSADVGLVETGECPMAKSAVSCSIWQRRAEFAEFPADAPTDGSILLMPVFASDFGISPTNPRFSYTMNAFDRPAQGSR